MNSIYVLRMISVALMAASIFIVIVTFLRIRKMKKARALVGHRVSFVYDGRKLIGTVRLTDLRYREPVLWVDVIGETGHFRVAYKLCKLADETEVYN